MNQNDKNLIYEDGLSAGYEYGLATGKNNFTNFQIKLTKKLRIIQDEGIMTISYQLNKFNIEQEEFYIEIKDTINNNTLGKLF